jgi:hypothetical protein
VLSLLYKGVVVLAVSLNTWLTLHHPPASVKHQFDYPCHPAWRRERVISKGARALASGRPPPQIRATRAIAAGTRPTRTAH